MCQKTSLGIWIICTVLFCAGCTGESVQLSKLVPAGGQAKATVEQVSPVDGKSSFSNQTLELKNCDGKEDLHKSLASEAQVVCTISIADKATATTTGADLELSLEMKTNLEEQVKSAYQSAYEEARASVEQKDIVVPIGKIHTYTIFWKQQIFNSTVSFKTDGVTYTTPYTYTLDIPRITIKEQTGCTA